MKKTLAILLALVMILSLATTAMADTTTGTITIENAVVGETYSVIKLFDASVSTTTTEVEGKPVTTTHIVYTGDIPSALTSVFTKNSSGNIVVVEGKTDDEVITAVQAWAKTQTPTDDNTKTAESTTVTFTGLAYGYYAVTTTLGTVVTIDSTTPNATVQEKNSAPSVDKEITGASDVNEDGESAIAEVGSTVTYQATITVGTGAKNYVYHDTMETGLSYGSISSIVVKYADTTKADKTLTETTDYVVKTGDDAKHTVGETTTQHTFDVDFTDSLEASLSVGDKIIITYTATVTSDALTANPATNTASVTYGQKGETTTDTVKVYNATITVTKTDNSNQALAGAGFVLKNTDGKYYKYTAVTTDAPATVSWVDIGTTTVEAAVLAGTITEYKTTTGENGNVISFAGLSSGTYTLIESTVPDGYNKAADKSITIAEDNYEASNLSKSETVVNNSGTELPSTGGIGTTLFYVFGAILVVGAAVLLVTKKRMSTEA